MVDFVNFLEQLFYKPLANSSPFMILLHVFNASFLQREDIILRGYAE